MRAVEFLIPGALETPTGGYGYDRRIVAGLREHGWRAVVHELGGDFPRPSRRSLAGMADVLAGLPDGSLVVVDGLALGGAARVLEPAARRLRLVALVHHPPALEAGLDETVSLDLERAERTALALCRRVVVTSAWTGRTLGDFGVAPVRVDVVEPGTDPAPRAHGTRDPLTLLCVATLTPRKGHRVLLDALARLAPARWRLDCAGSATRDPATAAALRRAAARAGLADRVEWHGAVAAAALERLYARADVFVLASELEGYGMALTEALAHGLPVVSTTAGAIPETVPGDAGLLVAPGDAAALAAALESVLGDTALRERLAAGALAARARLPSWDAASRAFAAALERAALP